MSKLYIIPTPIGNMGDITYRAIELLQEVDIILAEDTRVTKKLLNHYNISTPTKSYHSFNEHQIVDDIVNRLKGGTTIALVSDAGTPAISDPGYLLAKKCLSNDIVVECLPGATALIPALAISGIPCSSFVFEGFLPQKKGRQTRLKFLENESRTMIFYESPHRIIKTLKDFKTIFGAERLISVSRELTKKFEETIRGSIEHVENHFSQNIIKGEFVVIVSGKK